MRSLFLILVSAIGWLSTAPALAANTPSPPDHPMTRAEIERQKAQLRAQESDLKERDRERAWRDRRPRTWLGAQVGAGYGSVDVCPGEPKCERDGMFGTYSGNLTITGVSGLLRLRASRGTQKGSNAHMPYEEAALFGTRFGYSNWYGALGYGRIVHPHDGYAGDLRGVAYDLFWAPSSFGAAGFEISFHGMLGGEGGYEAVNLGLRFGKLR